MIAISLCMIVKDEEDNLKKCLQEIAGFMDEIIIVDTGSSDRTKEIALKYTNQVYDFQWVDDFSAARNYSISKANNEYILVLDSDEFTDSINMEEMKRMIIRTPLGVGRLLRINEYSRGGIPYQYHERVNRLFSRKYYHYEGVIHEQLVPLETEKIRVSKNDGDYYEENSYHIPLTVRHSGYQGDLEVRKKKTSRNINLLNKALEFNQDDPYLLYQLGKSYYMEEDYLSACKYFDKALYYDLNPRLEYVADMVESYGYCLINTKQYEAAMNLINVYEEFSYSADFIFMIANVLMNNGKFQQAVDEFIKATNKSQCKMEGVNDFLAYYNIGVIYECLGDFSNAVTYYKKCRNYKPADIRLALIAGKQS